MAVVVGATDSSVALVLRAEVAWSLVVVLFVSYFFGCWVRFTRWSLLLRVGIVSHGRLAFGTRCAMAWLLPLGEKAFNKYFIKKVKSSWEGNKSPFVRNYQKGQLHKPVPRFLRREDPLQFPDELPLMAKSHMHGRWTQLRNHGKAWMDYPDTYQTHRWFVLPPNVPQDPKH